MRLRILLIALVSATMAQQQNVQRPSRAPQAQIKYHDPNGLKVDWKFFAPQNQWRSHLQNYQKLQQEGSSRPQQSPLTQSHPQSQLVQVEPDHLHRSYSQQQVQSVPQPDSAQLQYKSFVQPQPAEVQSNPGQLQYKAYPQPQAPEVDPNQVQYNKYSEAPSHVKQVVLDNFKPQRPYADPSAFIYSANTADSSQYEQQSPASELSLYGQPGVDNEQPEQQKTRREYSDRGLQGKIIYKEEYEQLVQQQRQEQQTEHVPVPVERLPPQPTQKLIVDSTMPSEIQQLLHYQAQIPYDVIANSITYKPKTLFVPKPLTSDSKGQYSYRSKVYYVNNDEYQPDFETVKPVEEEQRH